ncbi:MAG: HDIG domain-containing protein [Armatimonadota bacterium]|nr:HDIG domain-containing protein [Armatimonadota bacterium]MDR5702028.1 HDIG domain-containing protein [Armatimonadota bacterium]
MLTREQAWEIVTSWIAGENLRKHLLAVEAGMRAYARRFGDDEETWGIVGLLHDLDYERCPSQEAGHPFVGVEYLRSIGFPEELCRAILSHADYSGVPRESLLERALFACDELTGFIVAVALVKPNKTLAEVDVDSVKRKLKDKAFARAVRREDILKGAELLGISLDEHIEVVLGAMQEIAPTLGL